MVVRVDGRNAVQIRLKRAIGRCVQRGLAGGQGWGDDQECQTSKAEQGMSPAVFKIINVAQTRAVLPDQVGTLLRVIWDATVTSSIVTGGFTRTTDEAPRQISNGLQSSRRLIVSYVFIAFRHKE